MNTIDMIRCKQPCWAIFTILIAISCGTDALQVSGEWHFEGLEGVAINKIIPSFDNDRLILATDDGVFIYDEGQFTSAGLHGKDIVDLVVLSDNEMLVGIRVFELDVGEPSLFKTTDGGDSWHTFMGNYGGEEGKFTRVAALAVHPNNLQHLLARGMLNVSRSMDGGKTWESLYQDWEWFGSNSSLLKIDHEKPTVIWAGGANAIREPNLIRTIDNGATWKNLLNELQIFDSGFRSTAYSIAIQPGQSDQLLLGLGVGVFRSTDLGDSWKSVFDGSAVLTMANSLRYPQMVYASGINSNRTLFVLVTPDFGSTWQVIEMKESPPNIQINHMVTIEQNGRDVLFMGTNQGLYRFDLNE